MIKHTLFFAFTLVCFTYLMLGCAYAANSGDDTFTAKQESLVKIEEVLVDDDAIGYATFHCINQKEPQKSAGPLTRF